MNFPFKRQLRLRKNDVLRELVKETSLDLSKLVQPIVVKEGIKEKAEIPFLPGQFYFDLESLKFEIDELMKLGINSVFLLSEVSSKTKLAAKLSHPLSIMNKAIRYLKKNYKQLFVIADICLSQSTEHGHSVVLSDEGKIDNDSTLLVLSKIALAYAEAGVDAISISVPIDGKIKAIRSALDNKSFFDIVLISNTLRYYSYLNWEFGINKKRDSEIEKSYKLDYRNIKESLLDVQLDINEGVDILMIKPSLSYLDIIKSVKEYAPLPFAAFNSEGEYYIVKTLSSNLKLNEIDLVKENLYSIKRAGADFIISYHTKDVFTWFKSGKW